jgi:hypothetical protein
MAAVADRNRRYQAQPPAVDFEDTDNDDGGLRHTPITWPRCVDGDDEFDDRHLFTAAIGCGGEPEGGVHRMEQQQDDTLTQPKAVSRGYSSSASLDGHTSVVDVVNGNVESMQSRFGCRNRNDSSLSEFAFSILNCFSFFLVSIPPYVFTSIVLTVNCSLTGSISPLPTISFDLLPYIESQSLRRLQGLNFLEVLGK